MKLLSFRNEKQNHFELIDIPAVDNAVVFHFTFPEEFGTKREIAEQPKIYVHKY